MAYPEIHDPVKFAQSLETLPDRFWAKVEKGDFCWSWTAVRNSDGYGHIKVGKRMMKATHVSLYLATGEWVPDGMMACHHCDNPCCVNPAHLFVGDARANNQDRHRKGRTVLQGYKRKTFYRGAANASASLTENGVRDIRSSAEAGPVLAERYGVSTKTISRVRRRESWAHVA